MPRLGRVESKPRGRAEVKTTTQVRIESATKSTTQLTLTFDQPIVLRGTPAYTTDLPGVTALSATSPTLNSVVVTFSASIATANEVILPVADPAIRSKGGGVVADTTFPLA